MPSLPEPSDYGPTVCLSAVMSEAMNPPEDPPLAALVEAAERHYPADSDEPGVRAVVTGNGSVVDVQVLDPSLPASVVGVRMVGALSRALSSAREGVFTDIKAVPGLPESTRALLDDQADLEDGVAARPKAIGVYTGSSGRAQASFDNRTQEFTQVYVPDLDDESLADVVRAANRALALAATGGEQPEPLEEQIDDRLDQLDTRLGELTARIDDSLGRLDKLL